MRILVTGAGGLIGSECVSYFCDLGCEVVAIDNNMRCEFFGPQGDITWNIHRLRAKHSSSMLHFNHIDIRNMDEIRRLFILYQPFDAIIHCAAQPSHDKAREIPLVDFQVNALGTLNLLECMRLQSPESVFVFMSTNKVYGDNPNTMNFFEKPTRYDSFYSNLWLGFNETTSLDRCTHSVFGASKLAADVMVQEYAKTYNLKTVVFRGGCLTGPAHSGVELHGFLSYLVKCALHGKQYKVYGYKGKQVRDNIHSCDVVTAIHEVIKNPGKGEVYNLGGGRENSISILEAIDKIEGKISKKIDWQYIGQPRLGDHICYISDMTKFKSCYPDWKITKSIDDILDDLIEA